MKKIIFRRFFINKGIYWIAGIISLFLLVLIILKLVESSTITQNKLSDYKSKSFKVNSPVETGEYDIVFGSETAPITIFMYSSYSCKYCKKFFTENFPDLKRDFIDKGKIRLVVKFVEYSQDPNALYSLQVAICVNKYGTFDKYHELLLHDYTVIYSQEFIDLVELYKKENEEIEACIMNHDNYRYIIENSLEFRRFKLQGTPAFIINDKVYRGNTSYKVFKKILKEELKSI